MEYKGEERLIEKAAECGFTVSACLDPSAIRLREEVRSMCQTGTCGKYGKNWSCPPGCGTLEQCAAKITGYDDGILLQTVGQVEDSFDIEGMQEIEMRHKENFYRFLNFLQEEKRDILPLGTGCCTLCAQCTYPDVACRFPDRRISSLEAYGVLVSDLCRQNGVSYYYGKNQIAYTAACLWKRKNRE